MPNMLKGGQLVEFPAVAPVQPYAYEEEDTCI